MAAIIRVSIETTRNSNCLPFWSCSAEQMPRRRHASSSAPHSMAEPLAIPRCRSRSLEVRTPCPSAMFATIDSDARSIWSLKTAVPVGMESTISPTIAKNSTAQRYTSSLSYASIGIDIDSARIMPTTHPRIPRNGTEKTNYVSNWDSDADRFVDVVVAVVVVGLFTARI
jgi:hypothetical protein